jgi:hypothetical protein
MKTCLAVAFLSSFSVSVWAQALTLWPSDLCDVKKHSDSEIAVDAQRAVQVKTGTRYDWPGATVFFKAGEMDLAEYGPLRVTVSNTSARALSISLSVKDFKHKDGSPGGSVTLASGAAGVIEANLRKTPWVLDRHLELVGMNGFPAALEGGVFNVRKTAELHVFLVKPDTPASFAILGIEASKAPLAPLKADTFLPFVDRFGQFIHADWPGKIHSEEELQQAKAKEEAWLAAHGEGPATDRNAWGGWAKGPQLKATGHFRTEKVGGFWWLVDPDGRLFFSHGVDCVRTESETGVQLRENYFEWLPEEGSPFAKFYGTGWWSPHNFYKDKTPFKTFDFVRANMLRKYGDGWREVFAELAHRRIRAWGLNTVANWSDSKVYLQRKTPYTVCLGTSGPRIEGSDGWWGKFPDPFSKEFGDTIRTRALDQQKSGTTGDPWCIGYFVDNELSWGKDDRSLAWAALLSPAAQPAKVAFRDWLEKKYATPDALNAAWDTGFASWDAFLASTNKPAEARCGADMETFHTQIAEQYYRVIRDALKAAAPDKLYLGCRIAWGAPSVYRAAAKHCDIVSVNIYQRQATKDLPDGSDDKPIINGEFHFGALDRGMFHTGLVATKSQEERAACYAAFVESCLRHPRYVGTHWFQWRDQALTGRGDGENYQIGFLTVTDQPYPELVEAARFIGASMYETRAAASASLNK